MTRPPSRYQFSLRTLLLAFVVLASSMATFGGGGIVLFVTPRRTGPRPGSATEAG